MRKIKRWSKTDYFINPYNFVSVDLDNDNKTQNAENEEGTLTGILKCRFITKTPIAVPDSKYLEDKNGHKTYRFFHYQDNIPVIPGSTIRGAVRSVYETITDSCFSTAKADSVLTIRAKDPFSPGVLLRDKDGKWSLYKADCHKIRVKDYKKNGAKKTDRTRAELVKMGYGARVFFSGLSNNCVEEYDTEDKWKEKYDTEDKWKEKNEGYLYVGERISGKRYEGIFEVNKNGEKVRVEAENIEKLMEQLERTIYMYRDKSINKNMEKYPIHSGYRGYEKAKERGAVPVWYCDKTEDKEQKLYLSMACIGRYVYSDMEHVIKNKLPCTKRRKLCKACALFGMASNEKMGSKVRITDAKAVNYQEKTHLEKEVTLRELASPHSSYFPFYRKEPVSQNGEKKDISHSDIRGRKHYWHTNSDYYKTANKNGNSVRIAKTQRNATMDLVKQEVEFVFYVYYERITKEQLEELLWTLTLGENKKDSKYCYKLGHGKPIGLGSVKILVDENMECSYGDGYKVNASREIKISNPFDTNRNRYKELMKILYLDAAQQQVCLDTIQGLKTKCAIEYPRVVPGKETEEGTLDNNDFAGYQWFGENYKLGDTEAKYYLPEILQENLQEKWSLPSLEIELEDNKDKKWKPKKRTKQINNDYKQKKQKGGKNNNQYNNKNPKVNEPIQT